MNRRERRKQRIARQSAASALKCAESAADSAESPNNASTGPRTEAGKAAASRNAVKHNLRSKRLTGTDLEVKKRLASGLSLQAEYQFTRSLDDIPTSGGPQNWNFPDLDYGNFNLWRRTAIFGEFLAIGDKVYRLVGRTRRPGAGRPCTRGVSRGRTMS